MHLLDFAHAVEYLEDPHRGARFSGLLFQLLEIDLFLDRKLELLCSAAVAQDTVETLPNAIARGIRYVGNEFIEGHFYARVVDFHDLVEIRECRNPVGREVVARLAEDQVGQLRIVRLDVVELLEVDDRNCPGCFPAP